MDSINSAKLGLSEFTLAEIMELGNIYKEVGEKSLNPEFCQDLATSFSCSSYRAGKSAITREQVQSWFQEKNMAVQEKVEFSPFALALVDDIPYPMHPTGIPEFSQNPTGKTIKGLSELAFEAKSAKDYAWYDVASFVTYRVLYTGELEARVRFSGYKHVDDEWVNVKNAVRERSIPLEPSECHRVKVGDLVLCFQEREYHAVYCDAHVVEIQRRIHDIMGCRCIFVVRYDHDNSEERVQLDRICCRPSQ